MCTVLANFAKIPSALAVRDITNTKGFVVEKWWVNEIDKKERKKEKTN
jgi:hypothetical protein